MRGDPVPKDVCDVAKWHHLYDFWMTLSSEVSTSALVGLKAGYFDHKPNDPREDRLERAMLNAGIAIPKIPHVLVTAAGADEYEDIIAAQDLMLP